MEDQPNKNPEIFTVKENVPVAKPPITSEEALTLPTSQVLSRLKTSPQGLNSEDATGRLNIMALMSWRINKSVLASLVYFCILRVL